MGFNSILRAASADGVALSLRGRRHLICAAEF